MEDTAPLQTLTGPGDSLPPGPASMRTRGVDRGRVLENQLVWSVLQDVFSNQCSTAAMDGVTYPPTDC